MMRRMLVAVLVLVVTAAGTWFVATRTESPAQVAARAEPPEPDPVVAALTRGFLHGASTLQMTAEREAVTTVKAPEAVTGVVTSSETPVGASLEPGSVLMRVDGRPVFVLTGAFDLYRDIVPGDEGDDVLALQRALQAAGYAVGRTDGDYGPQTQAAVRAMYEDAGYDVTEVTDDDGADEGAAADEDGATAAEGTEDPDAQENAGAAAAPSGPVVVRAELLMVPRLPATVASVAPVGTQVTGESDLVVLAAGGVVLTTTLPAESLGPLAIGATGTSTGDDGAQVTAQVTSIDAVDDGQVRITATADGAISPGTAYVLAVDNPAAETGQSLLAPVSAVVSRGGSSYVYVRDGDVFRETRVEVVDTSGGVAAIRTTATTDVLDEGSEVRIG